MRQVIFASAVALFGVIVSGPAMADEPVFNLVIKDHRFEPSEIEIPAKTKIKLVIKNMDSSSEEFESKDLRREKVIPGGSEASVYIGPLDAGRYGFIGEFNPKTARGTIIVK